MKRKQHYFEMEDICDDCWSDSVRIIFCINCHQKIVYPKDVKCDCCGNKADFIDCLNCGMQNAIKHK